MGDTPRYMTGDDYRRRIAEEDGIEPPREDAKLNADGLSPVREVVDDATIHVGDFVVSAGERWQVLGISTLANGDKQVRSIGAHPVRVVNRARSDRGSVAWQGYPPNWPACACGLPTMDGHSTCGRAGCGGL